MTATRRPDRFEPMRTRERLLIPAAAIIGLMTLSVLVCSLVYRVAVTLALRYGHVVGFQASDLKLITAILVVLALVLPKIREQRQRKVSAC